MALISADYYYTYAVIDTPLTDSRLVITRDELAWPEPAAGARRRMLQLLALVFVVLVVAALWRAPTLWTERESGEAAASDRVVTGAPAGGAGTAVAPLFSPEVLYWAPQIEKWAASYGVDPNVVATIMQIESCGDPGALSHAGARGLFQVMPFHFEPGEDMFDPDINARRGLTFMASLLDMVSGDVGLALVGYNGGPGAALGPPSQWLPETQRYHYWGSGIYRDLQYGLTESPTLTEWMAAGGASLCRQAATRLGLQ